MIKDILESMQVVLEEILSMLCYQLFFFSLSASAEVGVL